MIATGTNWRQRIYHAVLNWLSRWTSHYVLYAPRVKKEDTTKNNSSTIVEYHDTTDSKEKITPTYNLSNRKAQFTPLQMKKITALYNL